MAAGDLCDRGSSPVTGREGHGGWLIDWLMIKWGIRRSTALGGPALEEGYRKRSLPGVLGATRYGDEQPGTMLHHLHYPLPISPDRVSQTEGRSTSDGQRSTFQGSMDSIQSWVLPRYSNLENQFS